tara:strand:- start:382 stop:534 length:153 start_codon:yes stop_codon:yes gene_type:complete
MLLDKKDSKELTDKQRTFLSVLFSEADGDPRKAASLQDMPQHPTQELYKD